MMPNVIAIALMIAE